MKPRIIRPNRLWVHLRFAERPTALSVLDMLEELDEYPGIEVYPLEVQIPRNAWSNTRVRTLVRALGCDLPPPEPVTKESVLAWEPTRRPFEHQYDVTDVLLDEGAVFCCDVMGLGKTASAIQAAETVRRNVYKGARPVVIVGPKFVRGVWRRELLAMGAITREDQFCALETRSLKSDVWDPDATYYFVHYDIAQAWFSRINGLQLACAIADEVHWAKNGRTKRGKAAANIIQVAPYRILLTGTPMPNRPSELWHPLSMLTGARSWGSPVDFRIRYCGAQRNEYGWKDGDPTNIDELRNRLADIYIRRSPEDVGLNLPALTRSTEHVALRPIDARHNRDLVKGMTDFERAQLVEALLSRRISDNVLAKITEMRTAASAGKVPATVERVNDIVDQSESVVVFTVFKKAAYAIAEAVDAANIYVATGDDDQTKRETKVDAFQQSGGVFIATYGALKEGVTLHKARHVILHDFSWVPSDMFQAEKRIHRIGQACACTSTWLLGEETIDELLAETVYSKVSAHEVVFDESLGVRDMLYTTLEGDAFESRVQEAVAGWVNRSW